MRNSIAMLLATAGISLAASAYAANETESSVEYKKNGGYEANRSSESVSPDGTKRVSESEVDVNVNSAGQVDKTITTESTTDPKGLMNKKKDSATTEIEEKARGGYKQTTTSHHTDANGTNVSLVVTTDVEVDAQGNVITTSTTEKTVDPKGLMNKKTTTSRTKSVNGKVVEKDHTVD